MRYKAKTYISLKVAVKAICHFQKCKEKRARELLGDWLAKGNIGAKGSFRSFNPDVEIPYADEAIHSDGKTEVPPETLLKLRNDQLRRLVNLRWEEDYLQAGHWLFEDLEILSTDLADCLGVTFPELYPLIGERRGVSTSTDFSPLYMYIAGRVNEHSGRIDDPDVIFDFAYDWNTKFKGKRPSQKDLEAATARICAAMGLNTDLDEVMDAKDNKNSEL